MCNPKPGPRCYSHSSEALTAAQKNLNGKTAKLVAAQKELSTATDMKKFAPLRRKVDRLAKAVEAQSFKVGRMQRDVDGTETGQAELEDLMMNCEDDSEYKILEDRWRMGSASYKFHKHALETTRAQAAGVWPLLRIHSELDAMEAIAA